MRPTIDITNQKFGNLTAVKFIENKGGGYSRWLFKCDCGRLTVLIKGNVKTGNTKKCRHCLLNSEKISKTYKSLGMYNTKFFKKWVGMHRRCNEPSCYSFRWYGGRGIKVIWRSFKEFKNDMYDSYQSHVKEFGEKNTSIDRIDNNGNYCKENCRWATWEEQMKNRKSRTSEIKYYRNKPLKEWSNILGIKLPTLYKRLSRKWDIERVLSPLERIR